jgi:ferrochelatase
MPCKPFFIDASPDAGEDGVGILLVNLGTPSAPEPRAVRRYLRQFLSDGRVVELPRLPWRAALELILLVRPRRLAAHYRAIWRREEDKSPLLHYTERQAELLAQAFGSERNVRVAYAMRYGDPSIADAVASLIKQGSGRLLLVPLYPQYSATTTAAVCDETFRALMRYRRQPSLRVAPPFYDDPAYVRAVAEIYRAHVGTAPEHTLFSFHGLPQAYCDKGDPYASHCAATARALAAELGLTAGSFSLAFQSRFGRAKWLEPDAEGAVAALARGGAKRLAVLAPGFMADCLETLEEIAVRVKNRFLAEGGEEFIYVPCLNDDAQAKTCLYAVADRELQGWIDNRSVYPVRNP